MSLISELSKGYTPPAYAEIFKPYTRGAVAEQIGLSYGLTANILSGCRKPSAAVEKKLIALAARVEAELSQQEGHA